MMYYTKKPSKRLRKFSRKAFLSCASLPATLGISVFFASQALFSAPSASRIISQVESQLRGKTSVSRVRITIERPRFKRSMTLDSYDDRSGKKFFLRIRAPKKDKGITFLKIQKNLWQYIPKIGKEIKIEGSLMQDSWMGSDFSNDDLVKSSSIVTDYSHSFLPEKDPNEWRIELKPKPSAAVIWSRIVATVRKSDLMPIRYEFYDHKGRLRKRQLFSEYKVLGGRKIPSLLRMQTIRKGRLKSQTTLRFLKIRFDAAIPSRIFSRANLRR